jgi:phytoene dehydrogenase-like protein
MLRGREGRNLLVAITRSPYEEWRRWERTATGRRGADYEEEKASRARKLLQDSEEVFGPLADAKVIDAYSPLTLRDWVDTPEGSPYGILRSVRQLPAAATLHRLGPSGLWLAGQNVLSPGVFGTLMGSFHAVRQVVGADRFAPIYEGLAKGREKPGASGGRP